MCSDAPPPLPGTWERKEIELINEKRWRQKTETRWLVCGRGADRWCERREGVQGTQDLVGRETRKREETHSGVG